MHERVRNAVMNAGNVINTFLGIPKNMHALTAGIYVDSSRLKTLHRVFNLSGFVRYKINKLLSFNLGILCTEYSYLRSCLIPSLKIELSYLIPEYMVG